MEKTVVALFDNLDTAQAAVQELLARGFGRDDISVVRTNQEDDHTTGKMEQTENDASGAAAGAGIGAVLGGLAGLLVGLGALAIPGIGPIVAAGPLVTTLAGAGLGAATGGLVGALADAGMSEREAAAYAEGVRRGGTLVTVGTDEDQVGSATDILNRFTPVDINRRAGEWQSSGWRGHDAGAGPYSTSTGAPHTQQAEDMPKGSYQAGMGLTGENSGGTYEGTGSAGYTGSGTTYQGSGSFTSNTGAESGGATARFQDYDQDFRSDWESNYRNTGFGYERYQPAYQYGWQLGEQYQGRDWNDFEANARDGLGASHPDDAWQDFKDAIRRGWDRTKGSVPDADESMRQGGQQDARTHDPGCSRQHGTGLRPHHGRHEPWFRHLRS